MAGVTTVGETPSLIQEFGGKWGYSPARFALTGQIPKAPPPYNLTGAPSKEIGPK